ncbi:acyltransferase [Polaromonas sp. YR568]|uniref:acyltransferase n=1 Tax=Polaromonas sp. YR568 TaxID=1855301 RepID=UPI00398BD9AC
MSYLAKIRRRLLAETGSVWFRLAHGLMRGKIRSDFPSIARCRFGINTVFRGALALSNSVLIMGDQCAVANSAELGAGENGVIEIGDGVSIGPRSMISTSGGTVKIGSRTSFFSDCLVSGEVAIGEDCLFANNVTVLSGTHQIRGGGTIRENDAAFMRSPDYRPCDPITIGADSWLGANSVILPGVSLGRGTVVGANAVVTKSFPDYSILGGVPARIIGSRLAET